MLYFFGCSATFLPLKVTADQLCLGLVAKVLVDIDSDVAHPRISRGHGYPRCLLLFVFGVQIHTPILTRFKGTLYWALGRPVSHLE